MVLSESRVMMLRVERWPIYSLVPGPESLAEALPGIKPSKCAGLVDDYCTITPRLTTLCLLLKSIASAMPRPQGQTR